MRKLLLLAAVSLGISAAPADARVVEPGTVWVSSGVGTGVPLQTNLGVTPVYGGLTVGSEYAFTSSLSADLELGLGVARMFPVRARAGGRYRFTGLGLPLSPYVQAQLSGGGLLNVLGANVPYVGGRAAVGVDYFITAHLATGLRTGLELGSSLGARPAFYSDIGFVAYLSYAFIP